MGRIRVDLYPEQIGVHLADVRTFRKMLGGTATNVAVAAARLGHRPAVITKVGRRSVRPLHAAGAGRVRRRRVARRNPPDVANADRVLRDLPAGPLPALFYREPTAPDMTLEEPELDLAEIAGAPLFWTTGTGLSAEPSRAATLAALDARERRAITVHDLDHRPMFWSSDEEAGTLGREAVRRATVAVGGRSEAIPLVGDRSPADTARPFSTSASNSPSSSSATKASSPATRDEQVTVPPIEVEVVNGLGAGDAFGGALCHGLLSGWDLERTIRFANAAGALVASRLGCADDMPSAREVETLLAAG